MSRAVTGVILAGGESRRMGQDKAHLPWGDCTLIEHIIDTLRPVTDEIIVVAKDAAPLSHLPARVVEDLILGAHALGGLYTGLTLAAHERCFVCACDAPLLNPALIQFLIQQADGWDLAIPRTREGLQPLHAVYRKSVLLAVKEQLRMQQWDLHTLVPQVRACIIGPEQIAQLDPGALSFFNVNTPEDYSTARRMFGRLTRNWFVGKTKAMSPSAAAFPRYRGTCASICWNARSGSCGFVIRLSERRRRSVIGETVSGLGHGENALLDLRPRAGAGP